MSEKMIADVEPHLRTEGEIRELQPRVDFMAQRMCQTQGMVLWALKEAGLTVVLLDPHAREIAPDGADIAAAEERGRRRGYGECRDDAAAVVDAAFQAGKWEGLYSKIQSLAPRDSGPVCDAVLSSDPFREWRCGKPKDHEGPHSGEAPRDSGKEKP